MEKNYNSSPARDAFTMTAIELIFERQTLLSLAARHANAITQLDAWQKEAKE